ncbi:MAG: hypothetical protein JNL74_05655 [Fibrobacteres bacterium]|nr:hypothetical protein [Fibrobacterota bacterium]
MDKLYSKTNYIILGLGFVLLVAGYLALSRGPAENALSLSVAPVLLVVAYCILLPIAIIWRTKNKGDNQGV